MESDTIRNGYRTARPMNFQLLGATTVYFEHKRYAEGFEFLTNIIASGKSIDHKNGNTQPVYAPSTQQLSLAATLVVHPEFTTRAKSSEDLQASDDALRFLRHVHQTLGPINARFTQAFSFRTKQLGRRGKATRRTNGSESPEEDEDPNKLHLPLANAKSLFVQVEDIWPIVGWAFNCSVVWKKRWARWKLWLELFLDVLESDWTERLRMMSTDGATSQLTESMAARILQTEDGRAGRRRFMRAIMADGSEKTLNEFGEVWKNETKERKKAPDEGKKNTRTLNIDENVWGDYDEVDEEDEVMIDIMNEISELEGESGLEVDMDANKLRQRFLAVMVMVAKVDFNGIMPLEALLDLYTEFFRPMPFEQFRQLLVDLQLPSKVHSALIANTILPFLSTLPARIDVLALEEEQLIKHFLPHPANSFTVIDNAKMSFLIELLISNLIEEDRLQYSRELALAVQKGIDARKERAVGDARRKAKGQTPEETAARHELKQSAERIMAYVEILQFGGEPESQNPMYGPASSPFSSPPSSPPLSTLPTQSTPMS